MTTYLLPFVLFGNGLAVGIMLSTVMGVVPMFLTMSYDSYVRAVQFLWPRYDPFMPAVNGLTFVLDIILAISAEDTTTRMSFVAAAVLLLLVMVISVVKNVPMNRYVMSLDPDELPDDWATRDPRVCWRNWNTTRTALALAALVSNLAAVGSLL
ncbi:MAG: DUF1772 domain-containing protein [Pseudonocardiales bacterium]|nr:DUF1772 domain-containing protein [Pseudonocardiales bacterium]